MYTCQGPDEDSYKKLAWVMKYLWKNPNLALKLKANNSYAVEWWFDASYGIHTNMTNLFRRQVTCQGFHVTIRKGMNHFFLAGIIQNRTEYVLHFLMQSESFNYFADS